MKKKNVVVSAICLAILCLVACYFFTKKHGKNSDVQESTALISDSSSGESGAGTEVSLTEISEQDENQSSSMSKGQDDMEPSSVSIETNSGESAPTLSNSDPSETPSISEQSEKKATEPGEIVIDSSPSSGNATEESVESKPTTETGKEAETPTSEETSETTKKQTLYTGNLAGEEDNSF